MRTWIAAAFVPFIGLGCAGPAPSSGDAGSGSGSGDESGSGTESGDELGTDTSSSDETQGPDDLPPPTDLPPELDACDLLEQLIDAVAAAPDPDARQQLADSFVREMTYGADGFPIVADTRLCVFHQGSEGLPLTVTGDFAEWQVDLHPLIEAAPGFYYAMIELPAAPTGLYKFVHDQTDYFADPLARRFGWDQIGEYSQIDAISGRSHHERWPDFDEAIGALEPRDLTVWIPADGFDAPALPVLYMHDGQNLFAPDALFGGWQVSATLDQAVNDGQLAPVIVVGVDNTAARFDEYTQVTDVIDGMTFGGRADEYADFLVDGVVPFMAERYPVTKDPASVGVMGSSLGGLVSLYIGLRHPDVFGQVGSMSGTISWGTIGADPPNPTIISEYSNAAPVGARIYLDSGGSEGAGCPGDGSDNYCGTVELADTLRGLGWVDEQDLFYRWDPGAPHNEVAWANRLLPALLDWFPG
ncbi:alpha/beta hydrolase [Enhygromyxa salina]|uniref:Enterobactin/ferric enterobactin esterase n=1 Tax=Enhygromyxa salina TaxID=215803 RepID=A0A2S9YTU9_9BACT|nr:alpha/beta hydrolase-fold protein [Enhygromyxa salina]PRQ08516.1 enterobactin/ferric enterobactin esterase [Enhygromyxa salina]